jgi:hypothetical protein
MRLLWVCLKGAEAKAPAVAIREAAAQAAAALAANVAVVAAQQAAAPASGANSFCPGEELCGFSPIFLSSYTLLHALL